MNGKPRIFTRSVTLEAEGDGLAPVAVCPRRLSLLPVAKCAGCADFVKLVINPESGAPFMCCTFDDAPFIHPAADAEDASPSEDLRSLGITDVMSPPGPCVRLDATLNNVLLGVLDHAEFAPVLDEAGRALGLITRADVLQRLYDRARTERFRPRDDAGPGYEHGESTVTVQDMVLSSTFMVGSDALIGQVAAVMAYEGVQHVLVVDSKCALVGTVSALDLARWLACRSGYVVPCMPDP